MRISLVGLAGCHTPPLRIPLQLSSTLSIFKLPTISWANDEHMFPAQNHFPLGFSALLCMALPLRGQATGPLLSNVSVSFVLVFGLSAWGLFFLFLFPSQCPMHSYGLLGTNL